MIVGSSMGDNRGVDLERGTVRGFDARTGAKRWSGIQSPDGAESPARKPGIPQPPLARAPPTPGASFRLTLHAISSSSPPEAHHPITTADFARVRTSTPTRSSRSERQQVNSSGGSR